MTLIANITIPVYNDGVPEREEGFVLLFGVEGDKLEEGDAGFVDVLSPVVIVRLVEGGMLGTHLTPLQEVTVRFFLQTPSFRCCQGT